MGRDPKSALQEHVQASGSPSPRYRVVDSHGPDHDREFLVAVEVAGELLAEGRGRSKKLAEQAAARAALEKLGLTATEPSEAPPDSENANAVRGEPAPVVSAPPEAGEPPASTKEEP